MESGRRGRGLDGLGELMEESEKKRDIKNILLLKNSKIVK
jgi:hypothetical protein